MPRRPGRGNGMVRRRGARFQATIQIDGRRLWETFEKEADAWAWLATVKADAVRGVLKVEKKTKEMRFDDLARLYRIHKAPRWRPGTAEYYDGHTKRDLIPAFGRRLISTLQPNEIQTFLDARLTSVSGATVNKLYQCLTAVLSYAVRMGFLERSPMHAVERARSSPKPSRALRLYELQAFFQACTPADRPFWKILFYGGLRRSEIFRMTWEGWVDLEADILHVRIAKIGSSEIPMAAPMREAFLELGPQETGLVFPGHSRDGRTVDAQGAPKQLTAKRKSLLSALRRAGVDPTGISLHSFRHTLITLVEETGAPYSVVRALARHSSHSGDITARYLHPTDEQLRAALAALVARVEGPATVVPLRRQA